jgi:DNA helicase II / ATP-dependent DNA helicase PcrA
VPPIKLSDQQRDLVKADGHTFAEACPGAGKTRAIVARFLRRTEEEPRKGIALLSFTNAAVDEVRTRCSERADALLAPHFVGTFDSFINRFITRPQYIQQYGLTPRFSESWQGIRGASFRLSDMGKLPSFSLDWFELDWMLRASLNEQSIRPRQHRHALAPVIADRGLELEEQATKRCRGLVASGRLSCAASRALAVSYLRRHETAELFGTLLRARFSEIIVDEAQDCGPEELRVLQLLKDWGVAVVMVADLDQSIFEFRRADPDGVRAFGNGLGTPLMLDGNYRSSPAICTLNNSLRHSSREEAPAGDNVSCTTPVQLLSFRSPGQVAAAVEAVLATHDVPRNDVIFLAHRTSDARSCAGSPADSSTHSTNAVIGIGWASRRLRSGSSDGRTRRQAVELVERTLCIVAGDDNQTDPALDDRWLREAAVRLAVCLDPSVSDAKTYALGLRQYIGAIRWPAGITPRTDLGMMFKAPAQKDWLAASGDGAETFASATIHSAKGREFPAVVVVLPKNLLTDAGNQNVLDHWEQGMPSELRRVLYVGASRAQKLLILAAHRDHINRVTSRLKKDDVPHVLVP